MCCMITQVDEWQQAHAGCCTKTPGQDLQSKCSTAQGALQQLASYAMQLSTTLAVRLPDPCPI